METSEMKVTVLTAANGRWLTQVADVPAEVRVYAPKIYIGRADSPDNWREATDEERAEWEKLQELEESKTE